MKRVPITLRLTAAFAAATIVVLVGAGWFIYARLRDDFDDSIDATLDARWRAAATLFASSGEIAGFPLEDPEESFIQVIDGSGRMVEQLGQAATPALDGDRAAAVAEPTEFETRLPGIDGTSRILAAPATDEGRRIIVVGQSLGDRDEALRDLIISFALGGPVAVVVAAIAGYGLARSAFASVEMMRATATQLSLTGDGRRLPVPAARDEIRRLATTLNDMIERLEAAFVREQRFVADASHELRTPIAVIRTELESAWRAEPHGNDSRESLRAAIDECDSLSQLADDLLIIARAIDGDLPLSSEPTFVRSLLDEVRTRFVDRAAGHGRAIDLDAADVEVVCDRLRVRQALSNLIDNALRHGRGTITVRADADESSVHIDVIDEGDGFPPDIAAHAFERFARGAAARAIDGAGLGLAIVDTIARAHGGSTRIVGRAPTTVRLSLPR